MRSGAISNRFGASIVDAEARWELREAKKKKKAETPSVISLQVCHFRWRLLSSLPSAR